jgi:hypothetical protein
MPTGFSLQHWISIQPHLPHAGAPTIVIDPDHRVTGVVTRTLKTGFVAAASLAGHPSDYKMGRIDSLLMSVSVVDEEQAEVSEIIAKIIELKRGINY